MIAVGAGEVCICHVRALDPPMPDGRVGPVAAWDLVSVRLDDPLFREQQGFASNIRNNGRQ
jgi:hypothetical protein